MTYLITEEQLRRLETVHLLLAREIKLNARFDHDFGVDENYIMWGFRYALGRRTGAVLDVCETLKRVWSDLKPSTQQQIKDEIKQAIEQFRAGDECDIFKWEEILEL